MEVSMDIRNTVNYEALDVGLRTYMNRVYGVMASGIFITGIVAYLVSQSPAMLNMIYGNFLMSLVVALAPVIFVMFFTSRISKISAETSVSCFYGFSALMGLSISYIFVLYTGESICHVFFISAAMFLGMSIYGYATKKDLTGFGSFLMMGVLGLVIASLVNIFLKSSALSFGLSIISVLIFTGLTAYDVQKIKYIYSSGDSSDVANKKAVLGALSLYIDFINIFLSLLRIFGDRRD